AILVATPLLAQHHEADTIQHTVPPVAEHVAEASHDAHGGHGTEPTSIKDEIKQHVQHHLLDSHDFVLFSDKKEGKSYGFPLPVILWDNGLHIFSSSEFHHGETVVEKGGNHYALNHHDGKIYKTDAAGTMHHDEKGFVSNERPLDFSI